MLWVLNLLWREIVDWIDEFTSLLPGHVGSLTRAFVIRRRVRKAFHRSRSPLSVVDAITSPLLVLHGTDDPIVPVRQSVALAERMRTNGRPVELHLYEGEGHGWGRPEIVIDELERTEQFLGREVLDRRERA